MAGQHAPNGQRHLIWLKIHPVSGDFEISWLWRNLREVLMSRALFLGTGADEGPDGRYRTSVDPMAHIILVLAVLTLQAKPELENLAVTIA